MSLVVVGSANLDLLVEVPRHPEVGETIQALRDIALKGGGKGANQAVAAGRLGSDVSFLGQIGKDSAGDMLLSIMQNASVKTDLITRLDDSATGQAIVMLSSSGENSIIIIGGANMNWPSLSDPMQNAIRNASLVLLQNEIPDEINIATARAAKQGNATVIMDTGGRDSPIPEELLSYIDILSPNRVISI
jgi:ribokinase